MADTAAALAGDAPQAARGRAGQRGHRPHVLASATVERGLRAGRPRRQRRVLLPALLLHADGVLLGRRPLAGRRRRPRRPSRRGPTSTGRSRWCPCWPARSACPVSRLRLHVPADIGGSFGIKAGIYPYVALMALASRHAGRRCAGPRTASSTCWPVLRGRRPDDALRGGRRRRRTVSALRADLVDNVGRLPAAARAEHAVPLFRQHHRRLPHRRRADPGPRGRHQQDAHRAQPRLRRPAAVLRPGAPDGRGRRAHRPGPGRAAPAQPHRRRGLPLPHPERRPLRLGPTTPRPSIWRSRTPSTRRCGPASRRRGTGGSTSASGIAAVVDPSATNIGYVGLATPAENRARGLGKSGSTEHVRVSVDAGGIVTVLLGTVPQGQGHATVARQVVARPARPAAGPGAPGRRDGHRDDPVDGDLRQLLLPLRAPADQRARRRPRTGSPRPSGGPPR